MLVQANLEVHAANCEIAAAVRQHQVERTRARPPAGLVAQGDVDDVLLRALHASGGLEEAEDALGVPEDVLGPHEAAHGAPHRQHRRLGGDGCGGALGVGELLASPDGPEGHVVRHSHADGALDLLGRGPHEGAVDRRRGDRAVHDVVDLVALEAEDLGQASTDLVQGDHGQQRLLAVDGASHLRGRHDDWVKVVVAELASRVPGDLGVVAKDGAVGVPLADG
mmetsp:Transcript_54362/g.98025  ORF Transcript_54362/g.98025 Transcript_54362/m.98025 type:complete len:223 (-) Transcript_54362:449-1117(-)